MKKGLYEQVISDGINSILEQKAEDFAIDRERIAEKEANIILAQYIREIVQSGLGCLDDLDAQIKAANRIIEYIAEACREDLKDHSVHKSGERLLALADLPQAGLPLPTRRPSLRPVTPLAQSTLFTNIAHEPNLISELKKEIVTCDSIDMLVSFIKWSGIRLLMEELETFTREKPLRIITTSYMGASDYKAIEYLASLPNTQVRISYDTTRTRLHAKAYMFRRETGFSTAYIGSSNLSNSAITNGLEWNIKVTEKESREIMDKFEATFESYWHDREFMPFTPADGEILNEALKKERHRGSSSFDFNFDLQPYPFQKEILEKLQLEREIFGRTKNLLVAATGVGKTVISAFDYKRFCLRNRGKVNRLLFVAHREEILIQSLETFRGVLRDRNFGDLFYGGSRPEKTDYLFMTIQTFNSQQFYNQTSGDHYDFIVVDEFHHAAAPSYGRLLTHYQPQILLGLTATPERMDGKNVLEHFDGRIASELRLAEAIDRKLLSPFQYFCVTDELDLSQITWSRGGYDREELSKIVTGNTRRADLVMESLHKYVTDIGDVIGLGFCVSVEHAGFMAASFNRRGIPAVALHAASKPEERAGAKARLLKGEYKFIFVVDLYNEGVDIPEINTVLFLRPTESLTVFLQQLGRGLRLAEGKDCLTVLDFVGQAHKKYNYFERFAALGRIKGHGLREAIENSAFILPKSCHIQMERVAKQYILDNISAFANNKRNIINKIRFFEGEAGEKLDYRSFLQFYGISPKELYKTGCTFTRLSVEAGVREEFCCPDEKSLSKALLRLVHINSPKLLNFWLEVLENHQAGAKPKWHQEAYRTLLMLHYTLWQKAPADMGMVDLKDTLDRLYLNREIFDEVKLLLGYNYQHMDVLPVQGIGHRFPMEVHCSYNMAQILAAVGAFTESNMPAFREGVLHLKEQQADLLFITLNKVEKHYSPSTMYQDYAISDVLFHWQTQSRVGPESETCRRYIEHKKRGQQIHLFVRENKAEENVTSPFVYLGQADYVSHKGSKPVNIIWRLHYELPPGLAAKAEKAL